VNTDILNATRTAQASVLSTNRVIRNTYILLSMTLLFSAMTAGVSMALNLPHPGLLLTLAGYFGLLFATSHFRNSGLGLAFVFALSDSPTADRLSRLPWRAPPSSSSACRPTR
jgi:modulator of FtsH protease